MHASRSWLSRPFRERSTQLFLGILLGALALVTLLNLALPADHPLHVSSYTVTLLGKYLSYALLAVRWTWYGAISVS